MNLDELESKLRELEPRKPSDGFIDRVLAQKPGADARSAWWRRRVSIPVPALAALIIVFILVQLLQWRFVNKPQRVVTASRKIEIALVDYSGDSSFDTTKESLPFLSNPTQTPLNQ